MFISIDGKVALHLTQQVGRIHSWKHNSKVAQHMYEIPLNYSWKCTNELEEYNKKGVINVPWCNTGKHQRVSSLLRKKEK